MIQAVGRCRGVEGDKRRSPECDLCLQNIVSNVRSSAVKDNCGSDVASGEICSQKCCVSDTTGHKNHAGLVLRGRQPIGVF